MSIRTRPLSAVVLVVALVLGAGACSDDEPTPEEARLQRVEERLKLSFTDEQVECMIGQFSDDLLVALDGERKMPQAGGELDEFTSITQGCIIESGDTVPGTPGDVTEPTEATTSSEQTDSTDSTSSTEVSGSSEPSDTGTESPPADQGGGPATRPETGNGNGNGNNGNGSGDATSGQAG